MEETNTSAGFKEATESDFDRLTKEIKEAKVSGIFDKGSQSTEGKDEKPETGEAEPKAEEDKSTGPGTGKIKVGKYVKAPWVMKVVDRLVPVAIVASFKIGGYEAEKKDYKLDKEDMELLEEPIQELLDSIILDLKNPWNKLALAIGIVYGAKIIEHMDKAKKVRKRTEERRQSEGPAMTAKSTDELLDKLSEPDMSWSVGYSQEEVDLIRATRKRRNKSYEEAIEFLKKKGQLNEVQL